MGTGGHSFSTAAGFSLFGNVLCLEGNGTGRGVGGGGRGGGAGGAYPKRSFTLGVEADQLTLIDMRDF